jgi:hypothetical protein
VTGEHGQILLDHLEAADGATELLALGRIPDGLLQASIEGAGHLRRARHRAVQADRVSRHAGCRRGRQHRGAVEAQRVARLAREIGRLGDPRAAGREERDGGPTVDVAHRDHVAGVTSPRHASGRPAHRERAGAMGQRQRLAGAHGRDRERAKWNFQPRARK